ncbi:MAG TPA: PVC-type heme-binding CxxCH protein [Pirellulales bacterium]|jgi:putative membrane-bound dehydrogenase-like protein|nr:PVC-type heme-binding CxxCH protein [Pirellulales bacterium]
MSPRCLPAGLAPLVALVLAALPVYQLAAADQPVAHTLELKAADGFVVELAAGAPLVERPITMALDERGRLYVSDSSGSNDPVEKQLAERPHRVLRLEDTDGDGRFDRRTVFADHVMFPEGTMWLGGSLYVAAPPSIWKLTDADDDGVAERREEWFAGKTLTGCANDLHGPYRGRDGWIYWCKGAFAEQTYDLPGRPGWKTRASHIFRARPDGSGIEPVLTGGMDNPVDVVFTPEGERILSCTFLVQPGGGRRDGLIHAIYGGVYGKQNDVLAGHTRTGDLMPELTHLGPAAPCGLHCYESRAFGDDFRGNLLACQFNLHKVSRHKLLPAGASYRTEDSDFLTSDSTDFHPTGVVEDADGSVLVCDTGGWYKLCCPTSQFHKPNVLGAIYRIRREGSMPIKDPRGAAIAWDRQSAVELADLLADERPVVRERAIDALAARGKEAVFALRDVLTSDAPEQKKLGAVWALSRIDDPFAREVNVAAIITSGPAVRQAAAHAAGLWRDWDSGLGMCLDLEEQTSAVVRARAEALGRIGDPGAVGTLLSACQRADDRALEHSLIYAMIEIGDAKAIRRGLKDENPRTHRAALVALSQMAPGDLTADDVLPLLSAAEAPLRDAAWWIAERRPEWGEQVGAHLAGRLHGERTTEEDEQLLAALAQLAPNKGIQQLVAEAAGDPNLSIASRRLALRTMARGRVSPTPEAWIDALLRAVEVEPLAADAIASLQSLGLTKPQRERARDVLLRFAENEASPLSLRLAALETLREQVGALPPAVLDRLLASLTDQTPPMERAAAASVLAQAKLNDEQKAKIAAGLDRMAALELTRLLPVFDGADNGVKRQVLAALAAHDNPSGIRRDVLVTFVDKLPGSLRVEGDALLTRVDALNGQRRERLEELVRTLPAGNVERGHAVFNSKKAACIGCHAVAYVGGQIGPDLTLIGKIRTERDLLEAIVYPSASFVRSFEPLLVVTTDGRQFNGLLKQQSPGEIVLATGPVASERIARDEIEEIRPSQTSLMPEGLEKVLLPQELSDLIAYLKSRQ